MEKKSYFVVTETIVNFKKKSVDSFIKGISEELDVALYVSKLSKDSLIKDGVEKSLISDFIWGWEYKSDYSIIKNEIIIKFV